MTYGVAIGGRSYFANSRFNASAMRAWIVVPSSAARTFSCRTAGAAW